MRGEKGRLILKGDVKSHFSLVDEICRSTSGSRWIFFGFLCELMKLFLLYIMNRIMFESRKLLYYSSNLRFPFRDEGPYNCCPFLLACH